TSTDWGATAHAYRDLMAEWKAAGRAPREVDDKLWAAFRGAQDHFFAARDAVNNERDQEFAENAKAKDALIAEYDSLIDPDKNVDAARAKLRELQDKWEEIGFVPRDQVRQYEDKMAALEKRVSDAEETNWRRTAPEVQAPVDQFKAKVEEITAQAEAAEAKVKSDSAANLRAQAAQWKKSAKTAESAAESKG